jgi:hypothetical protein
MVHRSVEQRRQREAHLAAWETRIKEFRDIESKIRFSENPRRTINKVIDSDPEEIAERRRKLRLSMIEDESRWRMELAQKMQEAVDASNRVRIDQEIARQEHEEGERMRVATEKLRQLEASSSAEKRDACREQQIRETALILQKQIAEKLSRNQHEKNENNLFDRAMLAEARADENSTELGKKTRALQSVEMKQALHAQIAHRKAEMDRERSERKTMSETKSFWNGETSREMTKLRLSMMN